jgi:hypothetical protein
LLAYGQETAQAILDLARLFDPRRPASIKGEIIGAFGLCPLGTKCGFSSTRFEKDVFDTEALDEQFVHGRTPIEARRLPLTSK